MMAGKLGSRYYAEVAQPGKAQAWKACVRKDS